MPILMRIVSLGSDLGPKTTVSLICDGWRSSKKRTFFARCGKGHGLGERLVPAAMVGWIEGAY